jgi:hypothetical protein
MRELDRGLEIWTPHVCPQQATIFSTIGDPSQAPGVIKPCCGDTGGKGVLVPVVQLGLTKRD